MLSGDPVSLIANGQAKRGPSGTPLKNSFTIDRYLNQHIRRCRAVIFGRQIIWIGVIATASFAARRVEYHGYFFIAALFGSAFIFVRAVWLSFRRYDRVAAAMEIEKRWPLFDQRLITLASDSPGNALLDQIRSEVEDIFQQRPSKIGVSLRPLVVPTLVLIAATLIVCI